MHIICDNEHEEEPIVSAGLEYEGVPYWGHGDGTTWADAFSDLQDQLPDGDAVANPFMKNVYGVLVIMITTYVINKVLSYGQSQVEIMIMSKQFEKIRERIFKEVDVGLTLLNAESGYLSIAIPHMRFQASQMIS